MSARDWDEGDNGRVRYVIPTSNTGGGVSFYVDQRGVVGVQDSIDREKYETFRFPILAVDLGKPALTGSALIVITIIDVNDERPIFTQDRFEFNISENEPDVVSVGMVSAVDMDSDAQNSLLYSFLGGHLTTDHLSIDSRTGTIFTRRSFDREVEEVHRVIIILFH